MESAGTTLERLAQSARMQNLADQRFWAAATPQEHADALADVLSVADALPIPRRRPLGYPRLASLQRQ